MNKTDSKKLMAFLEELYIETRTAKKMYLSVLAKKHRLCDSAYKAVLDPDIVKKINVKAKKNYQVQWIYETPPNIYLVNKLSTRITMMNKEVNKAFYGREYDEVETNEIEILDKGSFYSRDGLKKVEYETYSPAYSNIIRVYYVEKFAKKNTDPWINSDVIFISKTLKRKSLSKDEFIDFVKNNDLIVKNEKNSETKELQEQENLFGNPITLDEVINHQKELEKQKQIVIPEKQIIKNKSFSLLWGALKINW